MKDIVILGGPNGAGKTTAAQVLIPKALGLRESTPSPRVSLRLRGRSNSLMQPPHR